ncbi:MAG: TIR domain-containing protein [Alcaligenaceae bacterium]|nr:MAG: TIR domain-containing protein [Alcaligenaceae bacterium]
MVSTYSSHFPFLERGMEVFISWSGERSHAVAKVLQVWLSAVLQATRPWLSSSDIERGSVWMSDINNQLQTTSVGIFCLTKQNKEKPWILFEAGAAAKGTPANRVCTLLIDLTPTDIGPPLSQFNHSTCTKEDLLKLTRTINAALSSPLAQDALLRSFEAHWPALKADIEAAVASTPNHTDQVVERSENDLLREILTEVRALRGRISDLEVKSLGFDPTTLPPSVLKILWDHSSQPKGALSQAYILNQHKGSSRVRLSDEDITERSKD